MVSEELQSTMYACTLIGWHNWIVACADIQKFGKKFGKHIQNL